MEPVKEETMEYLTEVEMEYLLDLRLESLKGLWWVGRRAIGLDSHLV